ncbi:EVE domain-containing protein [Paracraurococcus lichenis]|uniref:EVE domain-containing protein n=1 Tax=Paracraurococcus lichenis TaxID=3064888 RepID=A0ABT9EAT1_9PROT|nr:EVE domain-containing protein [Paracraurococcus sp. LOR1-02]MDO9713165.1 EVE domain-containing protein [Paracraurococcus sp. LOR1-02]
MAGTWIFQANPNLFDIDGFLATNPATFSWLVSRYESIIEVGDQVFIWRAIGGGPAALSGVIAEAEVIERVSLRPDDAASVPFWRDRDRPTEANRALLRLVRVAAPGRILRRDQVQRDSVLRNLTVLSMANQTNYPVLPVQADHLRVLWQQTVASLSGSRTADRLAPDLYAQRRIAGRVPPESPRESAAHAETGRSSDRQDILDALDAQRGRCAICSGVLGASPALAAAALLREDGSGCVVHAACRTAAGHTAGRTYVEGGRRATVRDVGVRERDAKVRMVALGINLQRNNGVFTCDICGQDHLDHPGARAATQSRLFEVHHQKGIAEGERDTVPEEDLLVLCVLCHRLEHA